MAFLLGEKLFYKTFGKIKIVFVSSSKQFKTSKMKTSIFKKDGSLTAMHLEAVQMIINSKDGKVYPNKWTGSGRRKSLRSIKNYVLDVANHFGYKVSTGNDAPRGGQEGFFVKFSTVAYNNIKVKESILILDWKKKINSCKDWAELESYKDQVTKIGNKELNELYQEREFKLN